MTTEEKELVKEAADRAYNFLVEEDLGFTSYETDYGIIHCHLTRHDDPGDYYTPPSCQWYGTIEIDEVYSGDHFDVDCAVIMKGIVEELEERFAL